MKCAAIMIVPEKEGVDNQYVDKQYGVLVEESFHNRDNKCGPTLLLPAVHETVNIENS